MEFPKSALEMAKKANKRYPNDVEKAVAWAERNGCKLSDFDDFVSLLIRRGWQELVYDARDQVNRRIKQQAGEYGGPAKVVSGSSPSVARVAESIYLLNIAGKTLGEVLGKELGAIVQSERAIGDGHHIIARFVERLEPLVSAEKRVREVLSEERLRQIYQEEAGPPPAVKKARRGTKASEVELAVAGH